MKIKIIECLYYEHHDDPTTRVVRIDYVQNEMNFYVIYDLNMKNELKISIFKGYIDKPEHIVTVEEASQLESRLLYLNENKEKEGEKLWKAARIKLLLDGHQFTYKK
jgi:hypothetical protein